MRDFNALTVDNPPRLSTDGVAFATSANIEHSGKVAPSENALSEKEQAFSSFAAREGTETKTDADSPLQRLKMLHSSVTHDDGPGLGSPSDSSLLLQLRIGITSTVPHEGDDNLTKETTTSNNKESGDSAGPAPFFLAPKKSEQRRRLELETAAWAAIALRFQERTWLT